MSDNYRPPKMQPPDRNALGGGLYWQNDQDNQGVRCRFTKTP